MGRGVDGAPRKPASFSAKTRSVIRKKYDTDLKLVQKKKKKFIADKNRSRGVDRRMKKFGGPASLAGPIPNPQTPVSAKQTTFPKFHLAFCFPYVGPFQLDAQ